LKRLSIQFWLTSWYFLSLAGIVSLFAVGSWFAMKASMYHAIDRDLGYRMEAVTPFIESHSLRTREQFENTFANTSNASIVGVFVQITDAQSNLLYESDVLASHRVPALPQGKPDGSISLATSGDPGWPVRVASKQVSIRGVSLTVHVIEPLRDLLSSLREYTLYFTWLLPPALLLATTAGYWLSRRAMAPVEQIRTEAEALNTSDLNARLAVPPTNDELARLAKTLNAMLSRIEASFRSVQQFTADASHELRAPLALIVTAGEVSLRRERSREELVEVLRKIIHEARHMSGLIESLLALARGDALHSNAALGPVEITKTLRELYAQMLPIAQAKEITLISAIPQHSVHVTGDGSDLRRLFLILLDNAIKYTETGSITLKLDSEDEGVRIVVADTGIGIEQSALPHIFDRFWRADKVRSRAEGGAGLGLSLASQIVQKQEGTISVESEVGRGTVFNVLLKKSYSSMKAEPGRRYATKTPDGGQVNGPAEPVEDVNSALGHPEKVADYADRAE
jgi:signal transduction histidine kinase